MSREDKKSVLIIELNEFNVELLQAAVKAHPLPNLAKVLALPATSYKTNDRYNSGYLEPWVQWVSVHTGNPASKHKIKHLGDVPDLQFEQCWETLAKHNITTGVWGVMNGERRNSKAVRFFLPDPWTFTEQGTPRELNHLLDLPRYLSKNYQRLNPLRVLTKGLKLLNFIFTSGTALKILAEIPTLLKAKRQYGKKHFYYISFFDYFSTLLFIQYKKRYKPQCSFLFLNSLAHLQHHHWREGESTATPEILFGLQYIDRLLGLLFKQFPTDAIVMHNGLSQMNTNHEKPWVLYRQKDPKRFLKALGIAFTKVEQLMTHDGHVFFASEEQCQSAYAQLKAAKIKNKPMFHVERNTQDPRKLFYHLIFTDTLGIDTDVAFTFNDKAYRFFDHFDEIVTRTGRHMSIGTVYSDTIKFDDQIYNHQFNSYLYHYLLPEQYPLRQSVNETVYDEDEVTA